MKCVTCGENEAVNSFYKECEGCIIEFEREEESEKSVATPTSSVKPIGKEITATDGSQLRYPDSKGSFWNYKIKGCFNCKYLLIDECKHIDLESFEEFRVSTFTTAICNNYKPEEIDVLNITPEQRTHYRKIMRKEVRK